MPGARLTDEERAHLRQLVEQGFTVAAMAALLELPHATVRTRLYRMGLSAAREQRAPFDLEAAIRMLSQGASLRQIARAQGVAHHTAQARLTACGIDYALLPTARHLIDPRLNIERLRALAAEKLSSLEIAAALGVSQRAVQSCAWRHGVRLHRRRKETAQRPKPVSRGPARHKPVAQPPAQRAAACRVQAVVIRAAPPASAAVPPADAEPMSALLQEADALRATGGRTRALAEFAEARGLTFTQALQRWHAVRAAGRGRGSEQ